MALKINYIETALIRLERAEEAIQEIRPILSSLIEEKQPGCLEAKQISKSHSNSSIRRKVTKRTSKTDTETSAEPLISEALGLLGKVKKEQNGKRREREKMKRTISLIETKKMKVKKVMKKTNSQNGKGRMQGKVISEPLIKSAEDKCDMNPQQSFWVSLANGHIEINS